MGVSRTTAESLLDSAMLQQGLYLALFSGDPTAQDTGAEVNGGGYARQPAVFSPAAWSEEYGGAETHNTDSISFGTVLESGETEIAYWGVYTANEGGRLVWFGSLDRPRTASAGDTVSIPAASLHCVLR